MLALTVQRPEPLGPLWKKGTPSEKQPNGQTHSRAFSFALPTISHTRIHTHTHSHKQARHGSRTSEHPHTLFAKQFKENWEPKAWKAVLSKVEHCSTEAQICGSWWDYPRMNQNIQPTFTPCTEVLLLGYQVKNWWAPACNSRCCLHGELLTLFMYLRSHSGGNSPAHTTLRLVLVPSCPSQSTWHGVLTPRDWVKHIVTHFGWQGRDRSEGSPTAFSELHSLCLLSTT